MATPMSKEVGGMGDMEDETRRTLYWQLYDGICAIGEQHKGLLAQMERLAEDRAVSGYLHDLEDKLGEALFILDTRNRPREEHHDHGRRVPTDGLHRTTGEHATGRRAPPLDETLQTYELELLLKERNLIRQWQHEKRLLNQSMLAYNRQATRLCWQMRSIEEAREHQKGMNDKDRREAEAERQLRLDALLNEEYQRMCMQEAASRDHGPSQKRQTAPISAWF
ncbi:hypothetical protein AYO20_11733 [Fonsecaea nubica]|uniref:Uncharacterized protein n=1 Tax=Fonsecaea nubica TaxID=856822 RepID=A0A178BLX6_9EURO|nr:hypothetical protein AYO20_11733 [Fonsecaea nubica]OAL18640.1 hypothetical protein AYO20_11733 [Fonsecaea nubica]